MDTKFFMDAMDHVGLKPMIVDENTVFPECPKPFEYGTPKVDLSNLQVISATEPVAQHRFDCALCRKSIHRGDTHKKWVYKEFGEFKSVRMHMECMP